MRICYKCGNPNGEGFSELRPYGENGQDICAKCCFDDQSAIKTAKEQFDKQLDAAIALSPSKIVILGSSDGPIPLGKLDEVN